LSGKESRLSFPEKTRTNLQLGEVKRKNCEYWEKIIARRRKKSKMWLRQKKGSNVCFGKKKKGSRFGGKKKGGKDS